MQDIKNRIKNLIPEDKKAVIVTTAVLLLFAIFIIFAYIPRYRSVAILKKDLIKVEKQIDLTQAMLGDPEKLGHILANMQKELTSFEAKLLKTKQISSVLSELSSIARLCSVDVVSIKPHEPIPLLDNDQNPIRLDESSIYEIIIDFKLLASYRSLADYLRKIQESLSLKAIIEDIVVSRKRDLAPRLDIELTISIFTGEK